MSYVVPFGEHSKAFGATLLTLGFIGGIILTLGFKDLYPDLEQRYRYRGKIFRRRHRSTPIIDSRRTGLFALGPVELEDLESDHSPTSSLVSALPLVSQPPPLVNGLEGTIGNTPLLELRSLSQATGRIILAKAEFMNGAGGSPKDRVALNIIRAAEAAGKLVPGRGDWIYEGTVGSTGISLATLATALGYHAHIFMPDDQAKEKSDLLRALGASVDRVAVAPITDPNHFVNLARTSARLHAARRKDGSHGFFADQFENPANWQVHFETTGPEIQRQTGGDIDAFVCGAGTGGTMTGIAKFLKERVARSRSIKIVLSDPQGSGLYNKIKHGVMFSPTEKEGTRRRQQVDSVVEGVGITRLTHNFDMGSELIDDVVRVTDDQALRMAQWLVKHDGVFCGSSSAVNCIGAVVSAMTLPVGSTVVTLLCDSGNRHLSKFYRFVDELAEPEATDLFDVVGIPRSTST